MSENPHVAASKTVFRGHVFDVRVDTLLAPDGRMYERDVVRHPGAVAIAPIDADDNVLLVRQYRHAVERSLLEIPAGVVEEGESPEDEYRAIDENTFIVEGGMSILEVNQQTIIDLPDGDYETIAGFALYVLGYIPSQGDRFEYGGMTMEITRMAGLKIEEIRVTVSERAGD